LVLRNAKIFVDSLRHDKRVVVAARPLAARNAHDASDVVMRASRWRLALEPPMRRTEPARKAPTAELVGADWVRTPIRLEGHVATSST
jgi:hypothetical protein